MVLGNTFAVCQSWQVSKKQLLGLTAVMSLVIFAQLLRTKELPLASNIFGGEDRASSSLTKSVTMEHCGCQRQIPAVTTGSEATTVRYNETTCSRDAFERGLGQNVVSFSFYGDINTETSKKKAYFQGILGNLELMPKYYPGWVMRLYFDLDDRDPVRDELCQLACRDTNLDLCHARRLPGTPMVDAGKVFAMNWRFFPTLDPQVDIYACRDLDSRFSDREKAAVEEFLHKSDQPVHSMRDHPFHGASLLGASWGTDLTRKNARSRWKKAWKKILRDKATWADRSRKGPDQEILNRYIWRTFGRHMSIQHDSYLCKTYPGSISWPTKRLMEPNNFVASVVAENASLVKKCPRKCRPPQHLDWEYC